MLEKHVSHSPTHVPSQVVEQKQKRILVEKEITALTEDLKATGWKMLHPWMANAEGQDELED